MIIVFFFSFVFKFKFLSTYGVDIVIARSLFCIRTPITLAVLLLKKAQPSNFDGWSNPNCGFK